VIYGSVCSGIEAASVAWEPLGWELAWLAEIEPFCCDLLMHYHPDVPNLGDMRGIDGSVRPIELLVGGTPCQSFSVAGKRLGLDDPRGNLTLEYLRIARDLRPSWLVWENVPGILSHDGGRTFGTFLGLLVQLGYGFAYRVLDAQFFGVPQRRRRVFVVGHLGDWRRAAAVLFERESLRGDIAPRRKEGEGAPTIPSRSSAGGGLGTDFDLDGGLIAGTPDTECGAGKLSHQSAASHHLIADHYWNGSDVSDTIDASVCAKRQTMPEKNRFAAVVTRTIRAIRRLTPRECERLQGFPDDYTLIPRGKKGKLAADGPRYKALGNSMAVPVIRWIGERIQMATQLQNKETP
jgi:DNA (cytosine-5)-methyltransferase 1